MAEYITAQQTQQRFGYTRSQLLRLEAANLLGEIKRTSGGQRRYDVAALMRLQNENVKPDELEARYYNDFGDSGLKRWNGHVDESDELRELQGIQGIKLYREMRRNHPVISAMFFAIENSLKQANMRVKPASESDADKACAEYIDQCLMDMSYSVSDTLDFVCQFLEVGTSILEMSYKRRLGTNPPNYTSDPAKSKFNDGRIGWRKWSPRPLESLTPGNEWWFDSNGNLQGIHQTLQSTNTTVDIPIKKLLLFRTTAAPYNSPLATPIHRGAYTSYYYSKNFQEIEGIGVERDLNGIPIVYMGNDCTKADFLMAKDLVVNIRNDEQAGIVIPHPKMGSGAPEGQGMLVELLSSFSSRAHNTQDIIERYNKMIALSVLTQFIMLGMDKYGSFSLAKIQSDLFVLAISAWLQKIADTINLYAIPRLLRYNVFPDITGQPMVAFTEAGIPDLAAMATFVNAMVGNEVIHPDAELERHMRQLARLPNATINADGTAGNVKPKPIAETALIIRRIILALKELPTYSTMSDEQLMSMLEPMVDQMRLGVEQATGVKVPRIDRQAVSDNSDVDAIVQELAKEGLIQID